MINTQYINLNMIPSGVMPVLYCSQYDIGRPLGVVVYNGAESVDLSVYTCTIEATRTDKTPVTAAVTTSGNIGVFETTATMTNQADTYKGKLVLTDGNGKRVASLAFVLVVTVRTMDEDAEEIEEDASLYQQYTGTVQTIIASIRADLAAEITARQNAVSAEATARQNAITAEANARAAAVSAEATARQSADNTLQSNINAEASTRATQDASLQSQIDQIIAPSGEAPSAAEVENARIGSGGTVYPTLGDAIRTQNSLLKSQLLLFNSCNLFTSPNKTNSTLNGITWTFSGDAVTATGSTSTNPSYYSLYDNSSALPSWMSLGKTYYIKYSGTDVSLRIYDSNLTRIFQTSTDAEFTVPNDLTGCIIRLYVRGNTSNLNETVKLPAFLLAKSNTDIMADVAKLPNPIGTLANGSDLNDVTTAGVWFLNSGSGWSYVNSPIKNRAGILEVIKTGTNIIMQKVCRYDGQSAFYRVSDTTGSFVDRDWHGLNTANGALPNGSDLNDVTDAGEWFLNSGGGYYSMPYNEPKGAVLEVISTGTKIVMQRVTRYDGTGSWFRVSDTTGSFSGREWNEGSGGSNTYNNTYETNVYQNEYSITCSPTITTDTNNYLASTGDTTDRTSAIQTMLNNTGVCHLGPGVFYVTGIQMPENSMLIGSGNATQVILASSVTSGCAVALGHSCAVRDIRFVGVESGTYTASETVGTRHAILFSATADAEENATNRKRCFIEGCQFWYFAGGAITCTNTGGRIFSNILVNNCIIFGCDAGINVAYFSEFHRFTNVSVNYCYYGCICNGGNCNFVNCSFSKNMVGILMDNSANQSPNNSHGTFSACTVCHSGEDNDGVAIKLLGMKNGEIFQGIQVHFGSIVVDSSRAIRFVGCQFGNAVPFELTNNTLLTFSDCSVYSASTSTVVHTGNTVLHFDRCYLYNGTVFDPTT